MPSDLTGTVLRRQHVLVVGSRVHLQALVNTDCTADKYLGYNSADELTHCCGRRQHEQKGLTLLAIGSSVGLVTIHSLPDGNAKRQLHAHRAEVWAVAFSPDGSLLVTAARDDAEGLKVLATRSGKCCRLDPFARR